LQEELVIYNYYSLSLKIYSTAFKQRRARSAASHQHWVSAMPTDFTKEFKLRWAINNFETYTIRNSFDANNIKLQATKRL